jgi:hypothetical protein
MRKKLFIVNGRYSTVHYPDRVSIVEIEDFTKPYRIHPIGSIHLEKAIDDKEACILALRWLQENDYITLKEYLRHESECLTAASRDELEIFPMSKLPAVNLATHDRSGKCSIGST